MDKNTKDTAEALRNTIEGVSRAITPIATTLHEWIPILNAEQTKLSEVDGKVNQLASVLPAVQQLVEFQTTATTELRAVGNRFKKHFSHAAQEAAFHNQKF